MTKLGFIFSHKSSKLSLFGLKIIFSPFNSLLNLFLERDVKNKFPSEYLEKTNETIFPNIPVEPRIKMLLK